MKHILRFIVIILLPCSVMANDFIGEWIVTGIENTDDFPWEQQVKYPKSFKIEVAGSGLKGTYKDQYDHECAFDLITLINNGAELLLTNCGSTKSQIAWSPVHKVKFKDGKLQGLVITNQLLFKWSAVRAGTGSNKASNPTP